MNIDKILESYPLPISIVVDRYAKKEFNDMYEEWGYLSHNILNSVLKYLSHMLLSDMVAQEIKPAKLFFRIQSILTRPLGGHYVGFLRDSAVYYQDEKIHSAFPELIEFLYQSEIEHTLLEENKPLLGLLIDYRNLWAHGHINNEESMERTLEKIRQLTMILLEQLNFLEKYKLMSNDGKNLMGKDSITHLQTKSSSPMVLKIDETILYPLLLKLDKDELLMLEDSDLKREKLIYKGLDNYVKFGKKEIKKQEISQIYEGLKAMVAKVRAREAILDSYDLESFQERINIFSDRIYNQYLENQKYRKDIYIQREDVEAEKGVFQDFLKSDYKLLNISGEQGTGKSSLACRLVEIAKTQDNPTLFINAQRFSFADVNWSGNPFPTYFSEQLHFKQPLDATAFSKLGKQLSKDKKLIIIIDAINEVDGIKAKWNRFRAMELLMEWISTVEHPSVKFILTFRADVYEEYEALNVGEDIPDETPQMSYPGNHPRHSWIYELKPFTTTQAQTLYKKLQQEEEYGMAPLMSWSAIEEGLGDKFHEFTTNPLLFSIFLKIHHQQKDVISNNKEKLFEIYGEKVVLDKQKDSSWIYKIIQRLKISSKEKILMGCYKEFAKHGGSFMYSDIEEDSKAQKFKDTLDTHYEAMSELKDAGFLQEESIERKEDNTTAIDKRISPNNELMQNITEKLARKIKKKFNLIFNLSLYFFVIVITSISSYYVIEFLVKPRYAKYGYNALKIVDFFYFNIFILIFLLILMHFTLVGSKNLDMYEVKKEYYFFEASEGTKFFNQTMFPVFIVAILFVMLPYIYWYFIGELSFVNSGLLITGGLLASYIVFFSTFLYSYAQFEVTPKFLRLYSIKKFSKYTNSNLLKSIVWEGIFFVIIFGFIIFLDKPEYFLDIIPKAYSFVTALETDSIIMPFVFTKSGEPVIIYILKIILVYIFIIKFLILDIGGFFANKRLYKSMKKNPNLYIKKKNKRSLYIKTAILAFFLCNMSIAILSNFKINLIPFKITSIVLLNSKTVNGYRKWKELLTNGAKDELIIKNINQEFGDFSKMPLVYEIDLDEKTATYMKNFHTLNKNMMIFITDKNPKLEWFDNQHSKAILILSSISDNTKNIEKIKRLFITTVSSKNNATPRLFKRMINMEALGILIDKKDVNIKWGKQFLYALKNYMPNLKYIEWKKNTLYTKDEAIKKLEYALKNLVLLKKELAYAN